VAIVRITVEVAWFSHGKTVKICPKSCFRLDRRPIQANFNLAPNGSTNPLLASSVGWYPRVWSADQGAVSTGNALTDWSGRFAFAVR
jgi:hypothetical protein